MKLLKQCLLILTVTTSKIKSGQLNETGRIVKELMCLPTSAKRFTEDKMH